MKMAAERTRLASHGRYATRVRPVNCRQAFGLNADCGSVAAIRSLHRRRLCQKSPEGTSRETVSCPAMFEKTWFKVVIGTALAHTVPPETLVSGTEKKYCDKGNEAMPCIVAHGVRTLLPALSVLHPVVSEPYEIE